MYIIHIWYVFWNLSDGRGALCAHNRHTARIHVFLKQFIFFRNIMPVLLKSFEVIVDKIWILFEILMNHYDIGLVRAHIYLTDLKLSICLVWMTPQFTTTKSENRIEKLFYTQIMPGFGIKWNRHFFFFWLLLLHSAKI